MRPPLRLAGLLEALTWSRGGQLPPRAAKREPDLTVAIVQTCSYNGSPSGRPQAENRGCQAQPWDGTHTRTAPANPHRESSQATRQKHNGDRDGLTASHAPERPPLHGARPRKEPRPETRPQGKTWCKGTNRSYYAGCVLHQL